MNHSRRPQKRGLFYNGIWHCDCSTRLPAEKFQCKNGGPNHGRWFYTCQKSTASRCGFFMFANEAEIREEAALLNNTNTEPGLVGTPKLGHGRLRSAQMPETPKRQLKLTDALPAKQAPEKVTSPVQAEESEDEFEWALSDYGITSTALKPETPLAQPAHVAPPRPAEAADIFSPAKRMKISNDLTPRQEQNKIVDWGPPQTPTRSRVDVSGLPTPTKSPDARRTLFAPANITRRASSPMDKWLPESLFDKVVKTIAPARDYLPEDSEQALRSLLDQYELRSAGIERGRDVTRNLLQIKTRELAEVQEENKQLLAEKEIDKNVIRHLKLDAATSPKPATKGPRPPRPPDGNKEHGESNAA